MQLFLLFYSKNESCFGVRKFLPCKGEVPKGRRGRAGIKWYVDTLN